MEVLSYLQGSLSALTAVCAILGLIVGSFLNVVIARLPRMLEHEWLSQCRDLLEVDADADSAPFSLVRPGSRCPHCDHAIRAWENIPVLSYLFLRGRCSACGKRISIRYPLVELLSGILSAAVAWHFGWGLSLAAALAITWCLIALSAIDIDHQILPDVITLPLLWLGLLFSLGNVYVAPGQAIIGAAAGYLSLWTFYQGFRLLTGKEGMGYGDFKLLAVFGAWMGWTAVPVVIILSSFVGAVVGVTMIVARGRDRSIPIPFGPYLAAAGWIALLWRAPIIDGYLHWAGLA